LLCQMKFGGAYQTYNKALKDDLIGLIQRSVSMCAKLNA
jgi:hypothetical protein